MFIKKLYEDEEYQKADSNNKILIRCKCPKCELVNQLNRNEDGATVIISDPANFRSISEAIYQCKHCGERWKVHDAIYPL